MPRNNKIESTIERRGGRYDFSDLSIQGQVLFLRVKRRAQGAIDYQMPYLKQIKEISFDIIDDGSLNAFATSGQDGSYFIGFNYGLVQTIALVFNRIMCDNEAAGFVGDPTLERGDLPFLEIKPHIDATLELLPDFGIPRCPVRRSYILHLIDLSLDFLLAHELGHIVSGHLDYSDDSSASTFDELSVNNRTDGQDPMIKKTLEMDADSWATEMFLTSELSKVRYQPVKGGKVDVYSSHGMLLLQFSFVAACMFKLIGDGRLNDQTFERETYPRPRLRYFIAMLATRSSPAFLNLNRAANYDLDRFGNPTHLFAWHDQAEIAFERITGKPPVRGAVTDALGEIGVSQINRLIEVWNNLLLAALEPHAHVKIFRKEPVEFDPKLPLYTTRRKAH